jgi:hypothetical protein
VGASWGKSFLRDTRLDCPGSRDSIESVKQQNQKSIYILKNNNKIIRRKGIPPITFTVWPRGVHLDKVATPRPQELWVGFRIGIAINPHHLPFRIGLDQLERLENSWPC